MSNDVVECLFRTPEEHLGGVMGKLTYVRAILGYWPGESAPKNENAMVFFSAQVPVVMLDEFRTWLRRECGGKVIMEVSS